MICKNYITTICSDNSIKQECKCGLIEYGVCSKGKNESCPSYDGVLDYDDILKDDLIIRGERNNIFGELVADYVSKLTNNFEKKINFLIGIQVSLAVIKFDIKVRRLSRVAVALRAEQRVKDMDKD